MLSFVSLVYVNETELKLFFFFFGQLEHQKVLVL